MNDVKRIYEQSISLHHTQPLLPHVNWNSLDTHIVIHYLFFCLFCEYVAIASAASYVTFCCVYYSFLSSLSLIFHFLNNWHQNYCDIAMPIIIFFPSQSCTLVLSFFRHQYTSLLLSMWTMSCFEFIRSFFFLNSNSFFSFICIAHPFWNAFWWWFCARRVILYFEILMRKVCSYALFNFCVFFIHSFIYFFILSMNWLVRVGVSNI